MATELTRGSPARDQPTTSIGASSRLLSQLTHVTFAPNPGPSGSSSDPRLHTFRFVADPWCSRTCPTAPSLPALTPASARARAPCRRWRRRRAGARGGSARSART
eukprot:2279794-Rhodomonas_salina.1